MGRIRDALATSATVGQIFLIALNIIFAVSIRCVVCGFSNIRMMYRPAGYISMGALPFTSNAFANRADPDHAALVRAV